MARKKKYKDLSYDDALKLVIEKLDAMPYSKLKIFALENGFNYNSLLNLKSINSRKMPTLVARCLAALGYTSIKVSKVYFYTFNE